VPNALPLWTSIVAEEARLLGGWVTPTRKGSPLAMLIFLSEFKIRLWEEVPPATNEELAGNRRMD